MKLSESKYSLTQFSNDKIVKLEEMIEVRVINNKVIPYITSLVRNKYIKLKPEKIARQLFLMVLIDDFHYPNSLMELENV